MTSSCQLCGSVEGRAEKRDMISARLSVQETAVLSSDLDARHFSSSPYCYWCLSSCFPGSRTQRDESEYVCVFKRNCLGLQKFLPSAQSALVFGARSYRDLFFCSWNPGLGAWCGAGTPCSQDIPPNFIHHMWVWDIPFCISAPPTSLDECGFSNSVIVRLPFNLISDSSE